MTFIEMSPDVVVERDSVASGTAKGLMLFGVRQDSDPATEADGDVAALRVNDQGRLKVSTRPAEFPATVQNITANGQTVPVDVSRASNVVVHFKGGGTAGAGGNFTFEGSLDSTNGTDGTWFPVLAAVSNANTAASATGVLALAINTGATLAWEVSVNAYRWFRVRATAFTSGIYVATILRGSYATEPLPVIQSHGITGTIAVSMASATASPAKAEDAAHTSADVGMFVLGVRAPTTPIQPTSAIGDYGAFLVDSEGKILTSGAGAPETQWNASIDYTTTGDVALKALASATLRNYVTDLLLENTGAAEVRVLVKDGTTRIFAATLAAKQSLPVQFKTPLRSSVNAPINVALSVAGTVSVHASGYIGF